MTPIIEHRILPMRTARRQFELAGVETILSTINPQTKLAYVGGKGGPACMELEEWEKYKALCATWQASPLDLEGAPTFSMLVVESEEDAREISARRIELNDVRQIYRSLRINLQEARSCVESARHTLSAEDYGEALEAAERKLAQALDQITGLMGSPQEEEPS